MTSVESSVRLAVFQGGRKGAGRDKGLTGLILKEEVKLFTAKEIYRKTIENSISTED